MHWPFLGLSWMSWVVSQDHPLWVVEGQTSPRLCVSSGNGSTYSFLVVLVLCLSSWDSALQQHIQGVPVWISGALLQHSSIISTTTSPQCPMLGPLNSGLSPQIFKTTAFHVCFPSCLMIQKVFPGRKLDDCWGPLHWFPFSQWPQACTVCGPTLESSFVFSNLSTFQVTI